MNFQSYYNQLTPAARELRKNQTEAERYFWSNILKTPPFDQLRWNRQKPLARFIADFYCAKLQLVIEIDGSVHDQQKAYDRARDQELSHRGITVVRFTNDEVFHKTVDVKHRLTSSLRILLAKGGQGGSVTPGIDILL